ncbi:MAG: hypothetical protein ACFFG0_00985 [Candidatus Thorarchaeota archaeon]
MILKRVIEVKTFTHEEQQFILNRFPESFWFEYDGKIRFYIDEEKIAEVVDAIDEFHGKEKE